jgi:hypothetical protein
MIVRWPNNLEEHRKPKTLVRSNTGLKGPRTPPKTTPSLKTFIKISLQAAEIMGCDKASRRLLHCRNADFAFRFPCECHGEIDHEELSFLYTIFLLWINNCT